MKNDQNFKYFQIITRFLEIKSNQIFSKSIFFQIKSNHSKIENLSNQIKYLKSFENFKSFFDDGLWMCVTVLNRRSGKIGGLAASFRWFYADIMAILTILVKKMTLNQRYQANICWDTIGSDDSAENEPWNGNDLKWFQIFEIFQIIDLKRFQSFKSFQLIHFFFQIKSNIEYFGNLSNQIK